MSTKLPYKKTYLISIFLKVPSMSSRYAHRIETGRLCSYANQLTCFCIIRALVNSYVKMGRVTKRADDWYGIEMMSFSAYQTLRKLHTVHWCNRGRDKIS